MYLTIHVMKCLIRDDWILNICINSVSACVWFIKLIRNGQTDWWKGDLIFKVKSQFTINSNNLIWKESKSPHRISFEHHKTPSGKIEMYLIQIKLCKLVKESSKNINKINKKTMFENIVNLWLKITQNPKISATR